MAQDKPMVRFNNITIHQPETFFSFASIYDHIQKSNEEKSRSIVNPLDAPFINNAATNPEKSKPKALMNWKKKMYGSTAPAIAKDK